MWAACHSSTRLPNGPQSTFYQDDNKIHQPDLTHSRRSEPTLCRHLRAASPHCADPDLPSENQAYGRGCFLQPPSQKKNTVVPKRKLPHPISPLQSKNGSSCLRRFYHL